MTPENERFSSRHIYTAVRQRSGLWVVNLYAMTIYLDM